ncbi:hypothetical protein EDD85DRAFT_592976 [Armillaria nabsnona]|nr:hypothetical protein EDD85DRAFT_592976 [Armillaria nabsnona]
MRLNAQSARRCFAFLDVAIVNIQAPLLDHLRGSSGLEPLLRALKWLGTSSTRVDILDSLPQLLIEFRKYCRRTMQCLDIIEYFVVGLHDFFSDEGCVGALTGPEEICRRMRDLSQFAIKGLSSASSHRYRLGLKGSKVRAISDYAGRYHLREDYIFTNYPYLIVIQEYNCSNISPL